MIRAELIFGAIKDENMNGKIRVSIVATALHGSETKPYLNLVNNNSSLGTPLNKSFNYGDNLFNNSNQIDKSIVNSIDGATALKLDESFEIKSTEEQNTLINNFENNEESRILEDALPQNSNDEIPSGVSIESASYIEKNAENQIEEKISENNKPLIEEIDKEYTPKLFSEEYLDKSPDQKKEISDIQNTDELFENDSSEDEDFEIPAFLRRQKF